MGDTTFYKHSTPPECGIFSSFSNMRNWRKIETPLKTNLQQTEYVETIVKFTPMGLQNPPTRERTTLFS